MKVNPAIFKMYDIRGEYPLELNQRTAVLIGRFYIKFLRKQKIKKRLKIALGRDVRFSSPLLLKSLARGIVQEGGQVVDLGLITTPMLYFAVSEFNYDGGAVITASHNPNPWNGVKFVREKSIPLNGPKGIFWIRDQIIKQKDVFKENKIRENLVKKNIQPDYLNFNLKLAGIKKDDLRKVSLAVDAGNGSAGPMALELLRETGVRIYPLYCQLDGSFPNHIPDPLLKENLKDISLLVKNKKVSLGLALDGDGDRIIFIDEKGNPVRGDIITAFMAKIILRNSPHSKILYDIRSSNIVKEVIKEAGGIPVKYKIGHALIKEKMRKDNILFGGELSGHYYIGRGLFFEVPFFVVLKALKEINDTKTAFSELVKPFNRYYYSGEINFEVKEKEKIIKKLKNSYRDGRISEIDGLKADFKDWWFLVRSSNTEPLLRLVVEAKTEELMKKKIEELSSVIKG